MNIKRLILEPLNNNCYIVVKNNDCLIIDPASSAKLIIDEVGNLNVKGILVTHHHYDHIGALDELEKYYHIKHNLFDDDFDYNVLKMPGHSDDSLVFYFEHDKIMFCGDFIFKGSIGRIDFPGGNKDKMIESLNNMKKYPDDIILYPGHGDFTILKDEKKRFDLFF